MSFLVRSLLLPFINPVSLANLSLRLQNNYSTSFRWLDHWFGTDDKFTAYRARVAASKAADRAKVEAEEDQRILARGGDQKPKNLRLGEEVAADGSESAPHNVLRMAGEAEARKRK
jgi:hypothetical protein